jgi:hypothetical protein
VRCIGGEITATDVKGLNEQLDRKTNQGLVISDRRVSDDARTVLADGDVEVFNLSEFLHQRVWCPYIDALNSLTEKDRSPERSAAQDSQQRALRKSPIRVRFGAGGIHLVPNEKEQDAICLMQQLRANGESYRVIATELERRGILTKEGKGKWSHTAVKGILKRAAQNDGCTMS